jgi:hypothetical protein
VSGVVILHKSSPYEVKQYTLFHFKCLCTRSQPLLSASHLSLCSVPPLLQDNLPRRKIFAFQVLNELIGVALLSGQHSALKKIRLQQHQQLLLSRDLLMLQYLGSCDEFLLFIFAPSQAEL